MTHLPQKLVNQANIFRKFYYFGQWEFTVLPHPAGLEIVGGNPRQIVGNFKGGERPQKHTQTKGRTIYNETFPFNFVAETHPSEIR